MPDEELPTSYLPPVKAAPAEIERLRSIIAGTPVLTKTLDAMLNFALILNPQRQAIYVNQPFREFLAANGMGDIVGRRIGDLVGCSHRTETAGGCGTTEACRRCGSAQAQEAALNGAEGLKEFRVLSGNAGGDLDFKVSVNPVMYGGEEFLLVSLIDISSDKRRQVLERLFFHDVINTAGGVQGLLNLMETSGPDEAVTYVQPAARGSERLMEQIISQKDLAAAERGDLQPRFEEVGAQELLAEVAALFAAHEVSKNKNIAVAQDCEDVRFQTDKTLLLRVIGNLLKNALEAESPGATVTMGCKKSGNGAVFSVHNPSRMPEDSRLQVFQRSFSTKGAGRGLGTYSIRLLTEKYLRGKVSFTTGPEGTTFTAEYPAAF